MSKNMTRKGLAFGAGFALVATGFAAMPAQADGIQDDSVVLKDTEEYGNYNMLTTGYIDISASFSGKAQSGSELKFYVQDSSAISVVDNVQQGSAVDTLAVDTTTGGINALQEIQGSTDTVIAAFDAAPGIEVGDVVDGDSIAVTGGTAEAITELNGKTKVSAVKEVASGNATSFSSTAKGTDDAAGDVTFTVTKSAHGIAEGDIVLIESTDVTPVTDTAAQYESAIDGYHSVTAATTDTFSFVVTTGADTVGNTAQTNVSFGAGTVEVHNVTVDLAGTADVTADSAVLTGSIAGGFDELTDGDALDSLANLRIGGFGEEAVLGTAGTDVARSTVVATLNDYVIDTRNTDRTNGDQVVRFGTTADTVDGSITVTAWIDDDSDDVIDATEYASDDLVITFVKPEDVVYSISQNNVFLSSDTVTGYVTGDFNLIEADEQNLLELDIVHTPADGVAENENDTALTYDTNLELLLATDASLVTTLATSSSVKFQVQKAGTNTNYGSSATFGVGSLDVAGSVMTISATENNTEAEVVDDNGTGAATASSTVRKGASSVSAVYTAYTGNPTATTSKVVPGAPYVASITSSGVTAADGVTVNDEVVDGGTETITGTTNASGQIEFELTQTAADASDSVTISVEVQGEATSGVATFTYATATYELEPVAGEDAADTDYNTNLVIGGTLTREYLVADQFGIAPLNGSMVVTATINAQSRVGTDTDAEWGYQVPVVDGRATVEITDDGEGTGTTDVDIKAVNLLGGGALGSVEDTNTYTITHTTDAADYTPAALTAEFNFDGVDDATTNDGPIVLETETLYSYDSRATAGQDEPTVSVDNVDTTSPNDNTGIADQGDIEDQLELTGSVTNAAGGAIAGSPVTISGPGLFFVYTTGGSETVYAMDEITVNTGPAGTFAVDVHSASGGDKTVTVTSGSLTATDEVTFAGNSVGADLTLTLPASVQASSSFQVTANLTDEFGDGADTAAGRMKVTYTGPGIYFGSLPTQTDANGDLSFSVLLGANDSGTIAVTVSYDENGDGDYTDADDLTVSKSLVVGQSADQKVNAGSFKGYVAVYAKGYAGSRLSAKIGNDWVIVPSLASNFERVVDFTGAGADIAVRIYIDRVLMDTINLTTK